MCFLCSWKYLVNFEKESTPLLIIIFCAILRFSFFIISNDFFERSDKFTDIGRWLLTLHDIINSILYWSWQCTESYRAVCCSLSIFCWSFLLIMRTCCHKLVSLRFEIVGPVQHALALLRFINGVWLRRLYLSKLLVVLVQGTVEYHTIPNTFAD